MLSRAGVRPGSRVGPAGGWGRGRRRGGGTPDRLTVGKGRGGGRPVAALGGRAEVMDALAPVGPVYQAGTLSGNPGATAAGLATLRLADDAVYARVDAASATVQAAVAEAFAAVGLPHTVQRASNLFSTVLGTDAGARDYAEALASEAWRYPAFFHSLLRDGVYAPPSAFEAWFLSAAHDDAALDRVVSALPAAARAAAQAAPPA